jgi:hypothetical protein
VILFGQTDGIVGSPSRGEPSFILRDIERVRFDPQSEDLYELLGGATLRARDGPVRVTRVRHRVMRIANESKRSAQVTFRDSTIVLDPGQAVELPLLSSGTRPPSTEAKLSPAPGPGFGAEHAEGAELAAEGDALLARGEGVVRALGVRVTLAPGTEARFVGLARSANLRAPPGPDRPADKARP